MSDPAVPPVTPPAAAAPVVAPAPAAAPAVVTPPAADASIAADRAELAAARKAIADRAAADKVVSDAAKSLEDKRLAENNEHKALSVSQQAEIARLKALEPDAENGRAWKAAVDARATEAEKAMDPTWKAMLAAQTTTAGRSALLDGYAKISGAPAAPLPTPPLSTGPPGAVLPLDIKALSEAQIVAGLRDPKTSSAFRAALGHKPANVRLDPFGRPN